MCLNRNEKCVNVCEGACSPDAICDAKNHIPFCSCPKGFGGDPFVRCEKLDPGKKVKSFSKQHCLCVFFL